MSIGWARATFLIPEGLMFKWACLGVATLAVLGVGAILLDLRNEVKQATMTVNSHLPAILHKTETTANTLALLSEDVSRVRDLAGLTESARDDGLVVYADEVIDLIEDSGATIGVRKLIGSGLKDLRPASEWAVDTRREALVLTLTSSSKAELLQSICTTILGNDWYIQSDDGGATPLRDWITAHHPPSKALGAYGNESKDPQESG